MVDAKRFAPPGWSRRHLPPLGNVDRLDDPGDLVDKGDGASDVVQDRNVSDLLPGHGHVLQELQHSMGHVLQSPATTNQGKPSWRGSQGQPTTCHKHNNFTFSFLRAAHLTHSKSKSMNCPLYLCTIKRFSSDLAFKNVANKN